MKKNRPRLENAQGFGVVWEIVKDTVNNSLDERRVGMLLFLDYLPLRLEASHPLVTNNTVLNRGHTNIVEVTKI